MQGIAGKIMGVAGIRAPLNDFGAIMKALRLPRPPKEAIDGFEDGYARKPVEDSCREHRDQMVLTIPECCRVYRYGYMIGLHLGLVRPTWIVIVKDADTGKAHTAEFWLHGNGAEDSRVVWESRGYYATLAHATTCSSAP